jgi:hypothetical protein
VYVGCVWEPGLTPSVPGRFPIYSLDDLELCLESGGNPIGFFDEDWYERAQGIGFWGH